MEKKFNEYLSKMAFNLVSNILVIFEYMRQSSRDIQFLIEFYG